MTDVTTSARHTADLPEQDIMNTSIAFNQIQLHTSRLLLRPLIASDAPALYAIFSDPQVTRYTSGGAWQSLDKADEMVARYTKGLAGNEAIGLGIVDVQSNTVIGTCSFFHLDEQCRRAEIGYILSRTCWGKGYMREALTALIQFGFDELNLHRIEADIDPRNGASLTSVERLGFIKEGYLRERWIVDGEICDTSLYGLLRSDWQARPAP